MSAPATPRTVVWRRVGVSHGLDLVRVEESPDGWVGHGAEVVLEGTRAWAVTFRVEADASWRTRSLEASVVSDDGLRQIKLESDGVGLWRRDGEPARELDGCIDVDIAATPLTNTLPIRRLGLAAGEQASISVAWVDVPSLEIERSEQLYTYQGLDGQGRHRWEYSTPGDSPYRLTVDDDGLVIDYERFATRLSGQREDPWP